MQVLTYAFWSVGFIQPWQRRLSSQGLLEGGDTGDPEAIHLRPVRLRSGKGEAATFYSKVDSGTLISARDKYVER